ncbi:MAG: hypothetical protein KKE64_00085, partial [Candidatus Omnitrophica bacterium]|nr:hypothetical protein [Candidatus Omnitrophota bacterium]
HGMIADIWNLKDLPQLHLLPPFPFGIAMKNMLALSKLDIYFLKWISLVNKRNIKFSLKSKVGFFYIMLLNKILGEGLIRPEFLDYKDIIKAVEFVDNILKKYKGCCIQTNISSAVRFCLVAQDNGISLEGLRFRCSGEPVTNAKNKIIEGSNAKYILHYALTEAGVVGSRCLRPTSVDDIHLFKGSFALISHIRQVKDANIDVFLLTTLLPFAPKILLNVEPGDYGKIETRKCGCPYDEFGLYDHIYDIRSFEKLCGDGATFFGPELMRIIEEILPSRFGGSNLDYQFVEKEDIDGLTRLFVYINPDINNIDEGNILATIIGELKKKGEKYEVMAEVWARLGTIKVIRKHPIITEKGKLYPLHILSGS